MRVERVMTDNGLAIYRSGEFNVPFESVDIRHVYASCSISDRTVKVGRTSLILTQKWQYAGSGTARQEKRPLSALETLVHRKYLDAMNAVPGLRMQLPSRGKGTRFCGLLNKPDRYSTH